MPRGEREKPVKSFTLDPETIDMIEALRVKMRCNSNSAVMRSAIKMQYRMLILNLEQICMQTSDLYDELMKKEHIISEILHEKFELKGKIRELEKKIRGDIE